MGYTKTVWNEKSVPGISGAKLNKIEQGIYEAHERIANMQEIPSGGTSADAALYDINIGFDGTNHGAPGDSVRAQAQQLDDKINEVSGQLSSEIEEIDKVINGDKTLFSTNTGYKSLSSSSADTSRRYTNPISVKNGMILYIENVGFELKYNIYACDSDGVPTEIVNASWITDKTYTFEYTGLVYVNFAKVDSTAYTEEQIAELESYAYVSDMSTVKVARKSDVENIWNIKYVSPNGNDSADGLTKDTAYKTLNRAMEDKPNVLYVERGLYQNQSIIADGLKFFHLIPYGGNSYSQDKPDRDLVEIYNGTDVTPTLDSESNLLKYDISFPSTHTFYKVFIDKSLPLYSDESDNAPKRNAQLWQRDSNNWVNDYQMNPVATLDECKANSGSFTYDGTALYINPMKSTYTMFTIQNDVERCIDLRNCGEVVLEDLHCRFALAHVAYIYNCNDGSITNCEFGYSRKRDNVSLDYSNVVVRKSVSYKSANDGWNIHGYGTSLFYDCSGLYNTDDGISHHEGAVGTVYGGMWIGNGKAGNAPTYGADVNIFGGLYSDNKFGLYYYSPNGYPLRDVLVQGCILKDNQFGIAYGGYNITASGIVNKDNANDTRDMIETSNNGGSFTNY